MVWVVAFKLAIVTSPSTNPIPAEAAIRISTNALVNAPATGVNVAVEPYPLPEETSYPVGAVMVTLPCKFAPVTNID